MKPAPGQKHTFYVGRGHSSEGTAHRIAELRHSTGVVGGRQVSPAGRGGRSTAPRACYDDFADDARVVRQSKALVSLYLRGRHIKCTTITSTQVWKTLHPHIRKNALSLLVLRLRNQTEIEALADELGALHPDGKKGILALYREATDEEYSYLYVDLTAKKPADMFYRKWKKMSSRNESDSAAQ